MVVQFIVQRFLWWCVHSRNTNLLTYKRTRRIKPQFALNEPKFGRSDMGFLRRRQRQQNEKLTHREKPTYSTWLYAYK